MGSGKGKSKRVNVLGFAKKSVGLDGRSYSSEEIKLMTEAKHYGFSAMIHRFDDNFPNDFRLGTITAKDNPEDEYEFGFGLKVFTDPETSEKKIFVTANIIKTTNNTTDSDITKDCTFIDKSIILPLTDEVKAELAAKQLTNEIHDWVGNAQFNVSTIDRFPTGSEFINKLDEKIAFNYFESTVTTDDQRVGTTRFVDEVVTTADNKNAATRQNELDKIEIEKMQEKIKLREEFINNDSNEILDNFRDDVIPKEKINELDAKYGRAKDKVWSDYRDARIELGKMARSRAPQQEKEHAIANAKIVLGNRLVGIVRAKKKAIADGYDIDFNPVIDWAEKECEKQVAFHDNEFIKWAKRQVDSDN